MARSTSLSGFAEWLPAERLVELHVLDTLRETFERHGFSSLESRAVETLETLLQKGEVDKEIYAVSRLQDELSEAEAPKRDNRLALRFDNTVPFARYVVENAGHLSFPFRRYQIQKVWRGERPQEGRYREFTQADIDVIGDGELPFRSDTEIAVVIAQALDSLPIGEFRLRINNRKLAQASTPPWDSKTPWRCCAASTSWRRSARSRWPPSSRRLPAPHRSRRRGPGPGADPHRGHLLRCAGPRAGRGPPR